MITESNRKEHDVKIHELKLKYERDGYLVHVEPQKSDLPFDLGSYVPDLIASKSSGGLIVEVKTRNAKPSIERYQAIADAVRQHAGWKFLLVTVGDLDAPEASTELLRWNELDAKLAAVRGLVEQRYLEPAVLYLWSIFEAAMRKVAVSDAIPVERMSSSRMMDHLYTAGYISVHDYDAAKKFMEIRNTVAHGFSVILTADLVGSFLHAVSALIEEWRQG
jgi:hypothetical protein